MLNSLIRVGMAGVSIVSAYITIVAMELKIASIFQASWGILFPDGGGKVMCWDDSGSDLSTSVLLSFCLRLFVSLFKTSIWVLIEAASARLIAQGNDIYSICAQTHILIANSIHILNCEICTLHNINCLSFWYKWGYGENQLQLANVFRMLADKDVQQWEPITFNQARIVNNRTKTNTNVCEIDFS